MFSFTTHSFLRVSLLTLTTLAILQTATAQQGPSWPVAYCSTLNTGSTPTNSSNFQTEGLCHDFCVDDYAFAVVQDKDCWCSNYVPETTTSTGSCDTKCVGYPTDLCGGIGLYGYIALKVSPSGTQGVVGAATTSVATPPASVTPVTVTESQSGSAFTVFHTVTAEPSTSTPATTSAPATTPDPTDPDPGSSPTWTPTPVVSVYTVTGSAHTVTYTPTSPPSSPNTDVTSSSSSRSGLSVGQAVGLTVGLVSLFAIIAGIVFCCLRKRRRNAAAYEGASNRDSSSGMNGPTRSMSQNSRYMLSTDGKQVIGGWGGDEEMTAAGTRRSRLMPVDPRLDPFAPVYKRGDGNKSRDSVATIRDDHDYSRRVLHPKAVLRATNPD